MKVCLLDKNNTPYITLENEQNVFCHYVATIQRLHSSTILSKLLIKIDAISNSNFIQNQFSKLPELNTSNKTIEFVNDAILPLILYAQLNKTNSIPPNFNSSKCAIVYSNVDVIDESIPEVKIYNRIREHLKSFYSKYVSNIGHEGYNTTYNIIFLFVPIIYILFPNQFDEIVSDLNLYPIDFYDSINFVDDIINENAFYREEYAKFEYAIYQHMIKNNEHLKHKTNPKGFIISSLAVRPSKEKLGGHAISLMLAADGKYYILDDQYYMCTIDDYFNNRYGHFYEVSINDIDADNINRINDVLHATVKENERIGFVPKVSRWILQFNYEIEYDRHFASDRNDSVNNRDYVQYDEYVESNNSNEFNKSCINSKSLLKLNLIYWFVIIVCVVICIMAAIEYCKMKKQVKHFKNLLNKNNIN